MTARIGVCEQSVPVEQIRRRVAAALPAARIWIERNPAPAAQHALVLDPTSAPEVLRFLRDDPELRFDFLSNVTGIDWPDPAAKAKTVAADQQGGTDPPQPPAPEGGFLECVLHLYSTATGCGPLVVRMRTADRAPATPLPSLTGLFASADLQEREIFDLYGIRFEGHPDLRRLLMWENFRGHPMRKDYVAPDDFEYEPTPHGEIEKRALEQRSAGTIAMPELPADQLAEDAAPGGGFTKATSRLLEVSLGPQHPSTHGVFRMNAVLDGETVTRLKPVFGYLHRNHEQIAEQTSWLGSMPYTDRLDYFCSLTNNWAYALSVERLAGIQVPERAEYLRVITAELTRLVNHVSFVGFFLSDMGAWGSVLMYAFREREKILDLFEELTGARMMCNYMRFGGCRCDTPPDWIGRAARVVGEFPAFLDEIEALVTTSEIVVARTQGLAPLAPARAIGGGLSGPILRASGVACDIRKTDRYGIYDRFEFRVPLGDHGDCYDRFMLRLLEMRESLRILKVALAEIPQGPVLDPKAKQRGLRPPAGESYARIEAPKGELGFYLVSTGGSSPYRYRVRPPSLINLTLLEELCIGTRIADVMVILGSIDIVLGEVDR